LVEPNQYRCKGLAEPFQSKDGREFMRISIPNQDPTDKTPWASFVLPAKAVHENQYGEGLWAKIPADGSPCGCPGSRMMQFAQNEADNTPVITGKPVSRLAQWPCQIKLVPTQAPFFDGAKLLIAADCTAYAYANMHEDFMRGKVTIIGCPKLDAVDYTDKLTEIIRNNDIKSVTIVRMEVPCCGGLQRATENALKTSGKFIPWQVVTISRDGNILD